MIGSAITVTAVRSVDSHTITLWQLEELVRRAKALGFAADAAVCTGRLDHNQPCDALLIHQPNAQ